MFVVEKPLDSLNECEISSVIKIKNYNVTF